MSKRKAMTTKKDQKIYSETAKKIKKINIAPKVSRGGIRL